MNVGDDEVGSWSKFIRQPIYSLLSLPRSGESIYWRSNIRVYPRQGLRPDRQVDQALTDFATEYVVSHFYFAWEVHSLSNPQFANRTQQFAFNTSINTRRTSIYQLFKYHLI